MDWSKLGQQLASATKTAGNGIVTGTVWLGRKSKDAALATKDAAVTVGKAYKDEWQKQEKK